MRRLIWLLLFAVAALFAAQDGAFAHAGHPAPQAQNVSAPYVEHAGASEPTFHFEESVSTADRHAGHCPHQHHNDSDCCCACAGSASAAVLVREFVGDETATREASVPEVQPYQIRQAVLDLSRPPKSFI
jgi:hypothetical protein